MNESPTSRRTFLTAAAVSSAGLALASLAGNASAQNAARAVPASLGASPQTLPPLPYAENALEPVISAGTIALHYGKHHRAYFDNLAKLTPNTPFAGQSLEALIAATHGDPEHEAIFNNAGQAWNHNFYWQSLSPSKTHLSAELKAAIERDFGSVDALNEKLAVISAAQFGSGWGWLVSDHGKLSVMKTSNADNPLTHGLMPLLTVDVWEHAYYLQYQNRRPEYLTKVIGQLINWDFASTNFAAA
ncbi:superoxide dismutase [Burkholderia cepacia]|uniref:superoxide dismutase n=1 Tax=Burkholderia cepacia TaxID=292 RepID=UPI00075F332B|nr:superoxide dismutase [Burkholderia cepacia]KUY87059.1 superoxide dismutase [Burkholderia cepacia]